MYVMAVSRMKFIARCDIGRKYFFFRSSSFLFILERAKPTDFSINFMPKQYVRHTIQIQQQLQRRQRQKREWTLNNTPLVMTNEYVSSSEMMTKRKQKNDHQTEM